MFYLLRGDTILNIVLLRSSEGIFLDGEGRTFFSLQEDSVIEETLVLLKKKQNLGHCYKLGMKILFRI